MTTQYFDEVARSLASAGTRRGLLQAITLALGAALTVLRTEEGEAGRRRRRRRARHRPGKAKDSRKGKRKGRNKDKKPEGSACSHCAATEHCDNGVCHPCDVCATGCPFDNVQEAIDAATASDTVRICAGVYVSSGIVVANVTKNVTLIGAGPENTVLDLKGVAGSVVFINEATTTTLRGLRFTGAQGGLAGGGVFVGGGATATLTDCTITGNRTQGGGAGIINGGERLTLLRCQIFGNSAGDFGGGIFNGEGTLTLDASSVSDNDAGTDGGGIYNGGGTVTLRNDSRVSDNVPNNCTPADSVPGCTD